jgi:hypothetical protein
MQADPVTTVANISLALSFIAAVIFGLIQIRGSARDRREHVTIDTLRAFRTRDFAAKMATLASSTLPFTVAKLRDLPQEKNVEVVQFYQEMESLGLTVDEGMRDLGLVEKAPGSFVIEAWKRYEPLIHSGRSEDPYLAEYFEAMAVRLEQRMRTAPRTPAYKRIAAGV